jgi:hypothetical protein
VREITGIIFLQAEKGSTLPNARAFLGMLTWSCSSSPAGKFGIWPKAALQCTVNFFAARTDACTDRI